MTGVPSTGCSCGSVRRPAVYTGGCSSSSSVSGPPATLASARSRCSCQAVRYSTVPNWRTSIAVGWDRIGLLTLPTLLGQGAPGDAAGGGSGSVMVAPGGGVVERLTNGVVVELETGALQRGRDGAL